jgi:hypothetical protein
MAKAFNDIALVGVWKQQIAESDSSRQCPRDRPASNMHCSKIAEVRSCPYGIELFDGNMMKLNLKSMN